MHNSTPVNPFETPRRRVLSESPSRECHHGHPSTPLWPINNIHILLFFMFWACAVSITILSCSKAGCLDFTDGSWQVVDTPCGHHCFWAVILLAAVFPFFACGTGVWCVLSSMRAKLIAGGKRAITNGKRSPQQLSFTGVAEVFDS